MEIFGDQMLNNFVDTNMLKQSLLKKKKTFNNNVFNNKHYPTSNRLKFQLEDIVILSP
jgi:hypothetical protein